MQGQDPAEFWSLTLASDPTMVAMMVGQPCVCSLGVWERVFDGEHLTELNLGGQASTSSVSGGTSECKGKIKLSSGA